MASARHRSREGSWPTPWGVAQLCDRRAGGHLGGTAGEQFDPCYHLACDTFDNVDLHALEVNSDLIAFAQLTFAYSTESVNGVPGTPVPGPPVNLPPPAGLEGTFASAGGGQGPGPIES